MTRPSEQRPPSDTRHKNTLLQLLIGMVLFMILLTLLNWTARHPDAEVPLAESPPANDKHAMPEAVARSPEAPAGELPSTQPVPSTYQTRVSIDTLADSQEGWLIIRDQTRSDQTSTGLGVYELYNEFRITTSNVQSFALDLSQIPVLKNKSLIMHIDGQDMTIRPRRQGLILFSVSPAGSWFPEKSDRD